MIKYCFKYWYNNNKTTYEEYHLQLGDINAAHQHMSRWNNTEQQHPLGDRYTYTVIE